MTAVESGDGVGTRRHRWILRQLPLFLVAACTLLSGADRANATHSSGDLLPDLQTLRPTEVQLETLSSGARRLRFATEVVNVHSGPLEMRPRAEDCNANGNLDDDRTAYQRVFADANGDGVFTRGTDTAFRDARAGCMIFHSTHNHWHFEDFAQYDLRSFNADGSLGAVVRTSEKVSFCVADERRVVAEVAGSPPTRHYQALADGCGQETITGMSVGWSDKYSANVDGQHIDISGLANGAYCLVMTADPTDRLDETDELNNMRRIKVTIASSGVTWLPYETCTTADQTPPDTQVTTGPAATTTSTSATFTFTGTSSAFRFECRLDGGAFAPCGSPISYSGLPAGSHTFSVRAIDAAEFADASPATWTWTIQSSTGGGGTSNLIANGSFEGTLAGWWTWQASLSLISGGAVGAQAARATATGSSYAIGYWPLTRSASGTAYNLSAWFRSVTPGKTVCLILKEWSGATLLSQASRCVATTSSWQPVPTITHQARGGDLEVVVWQGGTASGESVDLDGVTLTRADAPADTTPPETTISEGPPATTTSTDARFVFASNETGSTFQCALDGGAFVACTSPATYSGLAPGRHSFQVRATDTAGNTDASPATWTWTIESPPPPPPSSQNLIANGSFEGTLSGWWTWQASLSLISGGAVGAQAARATASSGATGYAIGYWPLVRSTNGSTYALTASLKSVAPGKTVCLILKEWSGTTLVAQGSRCAVTTSSWQSLTPITHAARGGDLEVVVWQGGAAGGDSFDLDGVSLTKQ